SSDESRSRTVQAIKDYYLSSRIIWHCSDWQKVKFLLNLQASKAESFLSVVIYKNSSMPFWFRPNLTFSVRSSLSNYSLLA
ncbi:MAG: hypothetical protein OET55_02650, partial [Desulfuromonadales bacterium]|nr:hypothetical protein [Desulfuromonadales bacterium]